MKNMTINKLSFLTIFFSSLLLFGSNVQAVECGPAPESIPLRVREKISGDLGGGAKLLSKLFGNVEAKAAAGYDISKTYQAYQDVDGVVIARYILWMSCTAIASDKSLNAEKQIEMLKSVQRTTVEERIATKEANCKRSAIHIEGGTDINIRNNRILGFDCAVSAKDTQRLQFEDNDLR